MYTASHADQSGTVLVYREKITEETTYWSWRTRTVTLFHSLWRDKKITGHISNIHLNKTNLNIVQKKKNYLKKMNFVIALKKYFCFTSMAAPNLWTIKYNLLTKNCSPMFKNNFICSFIFKARQWTEISRLYAKFQTGPE